RDTIWSSDIPHESHKAGDPADRMVAGGKTVKLASDIEIIALHADHRLNPGDSIACGSITCGSTTRDRRKDRDLVAVADRIVVPDIILVDRDPDHRKIAQCLGIARTASAQPVE